MTEKELARAVSARYRAGWLRGYIRSKIASDPAYKLVSSLVIDAGQPLIDIGCGAGIFAYYLREKGFGQPIVGVDPDARKIAAAEGARRDDDRDVHFITGDADCLGDAKGTVLLLDVLHYLAPDGQAALLRTAASHVGPDGLLLIRDGLGDGSWRSRVTRIEERMAMAVGWLRGSTLHFPTRKSISAAIATDFDLEVVPAYGRTPFNNHLVIAKRRPMEAGAGSRAAESPRDIPAFGAPPGRFESIQD